MPWRTLFKDPEVEKSLFLTLLPLIRYLPPLINHLRLRRIEKKLDGALKERDSRVATEPRHRPRRK